MEVCSDCTMLFLEVLLDIKPEARFFWRFSRKAPSFFTSFVRLLSSPPATRPSSERKERIELKTLHTELPCDRRSTAFLQAQERAGMSMCCVCSTECVSHVFTTHLSVMPSRQSLVPVMSSFFKTEMTRLASLTSSHSF